MRHPALTTLLQLLLAACLMLHGCTDRISHDELIGAWEALDYGDELPFYDCSFTTTKASFTGEFPYPYSCNYKLQNGDVQLSDSSLTHNPTFTPERITNDTLFLKNGARFVRAKDARQWPTYELPSVPGGGELPPRQKSTYRVIFHYYLDTANNKPVLRCGNRIIEKEEIYLALYGGHARRIEAVLFADRSIPLSRLRALFFQFNVGGVRYLYLVSHHQGLDQFSFVEDRLPIWWDELRNKQPPMPLPPPPQLTSREDFLASPGAKQLNVASLRDTSAFAGLSSKFTYLVSISPKLNFEDYLWIKQSLNQHRKRDGLRFRLDIRVSG